MRVYGFGFLPSLDADCKPRVKAFDVAFRQRMPATTASRPEKSSAIVCCLSAKRRQAIAPHISLDFESPSLNPELFQDLGFEVWG